MERENNNSMRLSFSQNNILIFLCLIYLVGITGHLFQSTLPLMLSLTPYTLFLTASLPFILFMLNKEYPLLIWSLIIFLFTFAIEAIGAATGSIFGTYYYTDTLGFSIFSVPLIIGINWILIILGSILLSYKITENKILIPFLAALFAVIFDLLLEPVAIKLNYWQWESGIIPLQNYIAWFTIAFISSLLFIKMKINTNSLLPVYYLITQIIFFFILFIRL
jgi:bisanhydrobacterioruberin hydratase